MGKSTALQPVPAAHLTIIHKATSTSFLPEKKHAVIQMNRQFQFTGWNARASELFEFNKGSFPQKLFEFFASKFMNGKGDELLNSLWMKGWWNGEVLFKKKDNHLVHLHLTVCKLVEDSGLVIGYQLVGHVINDVKQKDAQLKDARYTFDALVNILPDGILMVGSDGTVNTCNKRGLEILGLKETEVVGKKAASDSWKIVQLDGSKFPIQQFPSAICRQSGLPQQNVIMGVKRKQHQTGWLSVSAEALIREGSGAPYPVVLTFSDITKFIPKEQELLQMNERFSYVTRITSDAIWDLNLTNNEIYRNEAFNRQSGYTPSEIGADLNWWFDKVHPQERARVKKNLEEKLQMNAERWEDEYRFLCADKSYKVLRDTGIILYNDGQPVRILGAIRDITLETTLKRQLAAKQEKKAHDMAIAILAAQEEEKSKISRELHDNVNQILMSAKLFMESARQNKDQSGTLLDKAVQYQLLALSEIRKISRSLSMQGTFSSGLMDNIRDIVHNLKNLKQIKVRFRYDPKLDEFLNADEKLTVYRVVQEQTNNILKYSQATIVMISVRIRKKALQLTISDNGKGFDTSAVNLENGIGIYNMKNRARVHQGLFNIKSEPGNGCSVELSFPVSALIYSPTITNAPQK